MNKSLTIVLPVHNGESRLRRSVVELLELASDLTDVFSILIVDDGSTDHTYEVAGELASQYPQVSVRRHRTRRGLGATVELARRRVSSDAVIVHDGVTPIDTNQVRALWHRHLRDSSSAMPVSSVRELGDLRTMHETMAAAHGRVLGFHWITPLRQDQAHAAEPPAAAKATGLTDARNSRDRAGVGQIPPLPRPNFLSALADFALGE